MNHSFPLPVRFLSPLAAAVILLLVLSLSQAQADTLTWDSSGTNPAAPTNGGGTWSSTDTNWSDGSSDVGWNNANNDIASIGVSGGAGGAGTITLAEPITVGGMVVGLSGYTIAGSGANTLTLAPGATVTNNPSITLNVSVAGTDFTKNGAGTLTFLKANTYTGATTINAGQIQARAANALPATTTVALNGSAILDLRHAAGQTVAGISGTGRIRNQFISTATEMVVLTVNPDGAHSPADSTFAGTIEDFNATHRIALTKAGSHSLTLTGANTYTGNTTVTGLGALSLGSTGELRFGIQDAGVSNQILGDGNLDLDGLFRLDISSFTETTGTWNLVDTDLIETYGANFGLAFVDGPSFTTDGSGTYISGNWSFNTADGMLSVVPEPSTYGLMIGGMCALLLIRRRFRSAA